jgi:DNA (cytosine-5)-methyltransferase 1
MPDFESRAVQCGAHTGGVGVAPLRVLDLFSGIGGFSLGLERTGGFETVAFCEIEPFCRRVLAKHWPGVPCYDDVQTLTAERLAADGIAVDVIAGGFPCQDLSLAGKQAGLDGERSGLWSEIVRLAGALRPEFILVENVANLLAGPSERPGGWFGRVLGDLAALGYDAEWHCIQAAHVGAPHGRDRVWLVAYPERGEQPRQEPRLRALGRMGRQLQSVPWDRDWQAALASLRGMDDGLSRSVDRTDGLRNAVVPQIPELIGRAILADLLTPNMERNAA